MGAGAPQRLVARYRLCGLEQMPAVVMTGAAVVSGVLAGVAGKVWVASGGKSAGSGG